MIRPETRNVLVVLKVPPDWPDLPVEEIERKLRENEPRMTRHLAEEVKRWGNRDEIDTEGLQEVVDDLKDRDATPMTTPEASDLPNARDTLTREED